MSIKIWTTGYLITTLLGSFCPTQMAAALPVPEPMQHVEMIEVAMTPIVPMTLALPISVISASHTMPMPFSGNCQTGLCMGSHSNQQFPSTSTVTVQLAKNVAPHAVLFPVLVSSVALPAPPKNGYISLAQIISTVVLRV